MQRLNIAIGGLQHETNTFASLPTTLQNFVQSAAWPGLTEGKAVFEVFKGLNIPITGFIEAVQRHATDWQLLPLLWASAEPSGYVQQEAFDHLADLFLQHIDSAGPLDAIFLELHGAMVTPKHPDAEAELLRRIRSRVGSDIPIAISLDLHGNLSSAFFELASVVTIYRTYPHVDLADTGARAQALLAQLLEHGRPLCKAMRQLDYIIPITAQSTFHEPAKSLYRSLPDYEGRGVLSTDIALGFPPADIPDNGPTVFAYGTDQRAVESAADEILKALKQAESHFVNPMIDAKDAVAHAMQAGDTANHPVVIADPQDNPGAGGSGNTTGILNELLQANARNTAVSMFWDPATAADAHRAGTGNVIELNLGGREDQPGNTPIKCNARVERLTDGVFDFTGPMYAGSTASLGKCAVLHLTPGNADIRVVVVSVRCQNADLALFSAFGIDPLKQKILVVKSAVHFLAAYDPIAHEVLFAKAPGENPCDLTELPYTQLRPTVKVGPNGIYFNEYKHNS